MRMKVFYPNGEGKIEFTKEELEKLINDIYDEGRLDGERAARPYYYLNLPYSPYTPILYNSPTTATPLPDQGITIWCTDDDSMGRTILTKTDVGEYIYAIGNNE